MRVLIADDEELERRALNYVVSRIDGYEIEIVEAANGRQAVEELESGNIDLAILDILMPGMDGIAAAKEIRSISPHTGIIFITAFDNFEYAREALRLGVDEYLLKPADRETVRAMVLRSLVRIQAERSAKKDREQQGKEHEEAVLLLERELRESLERNALNGERFEAFLHFRGIRGTDRFMAVVRTIPPTERLTAQIMKAYLHQCAELIEAGFRKSGWFVMTAVVDDRIRVIAAAESEQPADTTAGMPRLWETIVSNARNAVGQKLLVGMVPWFPAGGTVRFSQALDALALANQKKPVIVLTPSGDEPAGDRVSRGDRGALIVGKAMDFIRAHIAEDLTLADAASAADCSSFYLSHLFKLYSGDTFIKAVMKLRMNAAKALLRTGRYSVKEVASLVGFHDQNYFSRIFRRMENRSPAEFRADPTPETDD